MKIFNIICKTKNKLFFLLLVLFLYACATKYHKISETEFYQYLKNNYESYGDYKTNNKDWKGARIFYGKVDDIESGKVVEPETVSISTGVSSFFSGDITYEQLNDMRERMMLILNGDTSKAEYPEETANMQFYYDCWVLEEELYSRYSQIARCKQGFIDTLAYLEYKLLQLTSEERDVIGKKIDNEVYDIDVFVKPKRYTIYFDFDSSALSQDSARVLSKFLDDARDMNKKYNVHIIGHADRTGSLKYNRKLSKRRANTIKHYLIKNGIPENIIKIKWSGELDPQVITSNDFKETLNRRVVVKIVVDE